MKGFKILLFSFLLFNGITYAAKQSKNINLGVTIKKKKVKPLYKLFNTVGKLTSKKAFLTYGLIITPALYLYIKFINKDAISHILNGITRSLIRLGLKSSSSITSSAIKEILNNKVDCLKLFSMMTAVYSIPKLIILLASRII